MEQTMQHLLHRIDRMLTVGEVGSDQEERFDIEKCDWWGEDGYSPVLKFWVVTGPKYREHTWYEECKVSVIFTKKGACILEAGTSKYVCDEIDISIIKKLYDLYSKSISKKVDEFGRVFLMGVGYGLEMKKVNSEKDFTFFDIKSRSNIARFSVPAPKLLETEVGKLLNSVSRRDFIENYDIYRQSVNIKYGMYSDGTSKHIRIYRGDYGIIFRSGMEIPGSKEKINDMKIIYNKKTYYRDDNNGYSTSTASVVGVVELFGGECFMYTSDDSHYSKLKKWQPLENMVGFLQFMHNNNVIF